MGKTMILTKGPTSRHVYERAQHFLQNDPDLQDVVNDFTQEMFTVQGIEVLGTPLGTDFYVRNFVAQNCIKISRDVEKLELLTDDFIHFQMIQKTMNTRTQYMSENITLSSQEQFLSAQHVHVDMTIANVILKKGTRGSFHLWGKDDHDLAVTIIQKTHDLGGLHQLDFHTQKNIKTTSTPDLDPLPSDNNDHASVLSFEMYTLESGETPTRTLNWNPLGFLSHIKSRTNDDRFPLSLWEVWFCFTLGVPIPTLIGPSHRCACNDFHYDSFGDHFQTCRVKSVVSPTHDWVVYGLSGILGSVGHRVKIHKITPTTDKERGYLEIKDYVVLQKPQEHTDRLPHPRTLILDFTVTHMRYVSSHVHTTGQLTNTRSSDGDPEHDGTLREVVRKKIYIVDNCILIVQTPYLSHQL
jgi:hypothetical protein